METRDLNPLYTRRRAAIHTCLVITLFSGLLAVCTLAVFIQQILTWRAPSIQMRKRVEADMSMCSFDTSQLPEGWNRLWADSYLPYQKVLPDRALGGITIGFFHHNTISHRPAAHSILFYRTNFHAAFAYRRFRITSYNARFHPIWLPLDLTKANLSADEYYAACSEFVSDRGIGQGDRVCRAKARYGRFLSVFKTDVSPRDMSVEEMIQVLQAIDKPMLQCVEAYADKEWEEE